MLCDFKYFGKPLILSLLLKCLLLPTVYWIKPTLHSMNSYLFNQAFIIFTGVSSSVSPASLLNFLEPLNMPPHLTDPAQAVPPPPHRHCFFPTSLHSNPIHPSRSSLTVTSPWTLSESLLKSDVILLMPNLFGANIFLLFVVLSLLSLCSYSAQYFSNLKLIIKI